MGCVLLGCVGVVNGRDGGNNSWGYDLMKLDMGGGEQVKVGNRVSKLVVEDGW